MNEARANSVKQLAELYNVVVGVALSLAMYNAVDRNAGLIPLNLSMLLNLITLIAIMIPFYHGAVRHLFCTYVEGGGSSHIKSGALLADFILLFIEGCIFVMLASQLDNTASFAALIAALLVLDCVWGFLAGLAFTGAQSQHAEKTWAIINFVAAALIIIALMVGGDFIAKSDIPAQVILLVIVMMRTVFDYYYTWDFYFPNATQ